jgi:RNA polymerase subunit RPABC4/transcription elongation factor Spt4
MAFNSILLSVFGGAEILILFLIIFGSLLVPILYLLTLNNTLKLTSTKNRDISPGMVWLYLIPIVGMFIHYNHIARINRSIENELDERKIKYDYSQLGYTAGRTFSLINIILFIANVFYSVFVFYAILEGKREYYSESYYPQYPKDNFNLIATSVVSIIFGIIYFICSIISFICWIIYWVKISNSKKLLLQPYTIQQSTNTQAQKQTQVAIHSPVNNSTKNCPNCKHINSNSHNFCIKCGFNFAQYEAEKKAKLKADEKYCPECETILSVDTDTCTTCGHPFQVKHKPIAAVNPNPVIEKKSVEEATPVKKNNVAQIVEEKKSNNGLTIAIIILICVVLVGFILYITQDSGEKKENIIAAEKARMDSIAAAEKAIYLENQEVENYKEPSVNETIEEVDNSIDIPNKIYQYYRDIQANNLDARNYFAALVPKYITKTNMTPDKINESIAKGLLEFTQQKFELNIEDIRLDREEDGVRYYTFPIHFNCFRKSKQKIEDCDVDVEIGVNKVGEFVYLKESKVYNLTFTDAE